MRSRCGASTAPLPPFPRRGLRTASPCNSRPCAACQEPHCTGSSTCSVMLQQTERDCFCFCLSSQRHFILASPAIDNCVAVRVLSPLLPGLCSKTWRKRSAVRPKLGRSAPVDGFSYTFSAAFGPCGTWTVIGVFHPLQILLSAQTPPSS